MVLARRLVCVHSEGELALDEIHATNYSCSMQTVKPDKLFHCTYALSYLFVFVTKDRRECLTEEMIERLRTIIDSLVKDYGSLVELKGEADHIQFLVRLNPVSSPSVIANNWKTVTSRLLRRDFPAQLDRFYRKPAVWSSNYFVATCGGVQGSVVEQYVAQQDKPE